MPEIEIHNPEDIKKLGGCHIHSARTVSKGPVTWLELEISHIMMPKIVRIQVNPYASFLLDSGAITIVAGLSFYTTDVDKEEP